MDNINSSTSLESTDIYFKRVLAGDLKNVRLQLMDAIENLGYDIIDDDPHIIARRGSKGWARSYASANVLDYATSLTLRLKALSENSTQVTFDYSIKHHSLSKGEHGVVLQEAKTIAALSKNHAVEKMCPVCETESTDDSKFCRKCGAPLTSEPAELEVLRMMAETRAGKTSIVASTVTLVLSTVLLLVTLILTNADLIKPKLIPLLFILGGVGVLLSIVFSVFGWNRLKRALEMPKTKSAHAPRYIPDAIEAAGVKELPPHQKPASVTEGTTNLLDGEFGKRREEEKVAVSNRRDTNDL